jgi:excisionase family DNA binding protein
MLLVEMHAATVPDSQNIYKWITRRSLPAHKVGRLWKFKKEEVDAWVRSGAAGDPEK